MPIVLCIMFRNVTLYLIINLSKQKYYQILSIIIGIIISAIVVTIIILVLLPLLLSKLYCCCA